MAYKAEKQFLHRCISGKNYITTGGLGGKHSFPDQITHTRPPFKSQKVGP